jgi:hypothetical protein
MRSGGQQCLFHHSLDIYPRASLLDIIGIMVTISYVEGWVIHYTTMGDQGERSLGYCLSVICLWMYRVGDTGVPSV